MVKVKRFVLNSYIRTNKLSDQNEEVPINDADSGILARFGSNSEIGTMLQYDFKNDKKFIFFDGTGIKVVCDESGVLRGPFPVLDLFREAEFRPSII